MAQFPLPHHIFPDSLTSASACGPLCGMGTFGQPTSTAWPAAKLAIYVPFRLTATQAGHTRLLSQIGAAGGAANGQYDIGVFTVDGTKIISTGLTNLPAANGLISAVVASFEIGPGIYYCGLSLTSNTGTIMCFAPAALTTAMTKMVGLCQQDLSAGTGALPASATFATIGQAPIPLVEVA